MGSCSGSFFALGRDDGRVVWSHDAAADGGTANFHGNILLVENLVVVGTDGGASGQLYAFDAASGEVRWQQSAPGGFPSDPVRRGDRILAVEASGALRCTDLESGSPQWSVGGVEGARLLKSSVIMAGGRAFVSLPGGAVAAFDAESGEQLWQTVLPARLNTPLARVGDRLYVGDLEGTIHQLASEDGSRLGSFDAEGLIYGSLLSAGECLLALWAGDTLACLDPSLSEVKWSRKAQSAWSSFDPLILDGLVVAGTESGEILALDLDSGAPAWTLEIEGEVKGLGASDDVLFVGTIQGRVYALPLPAAESD